MVFCFFHFYKNMNKLSEKQKVPTFKSIKAFSNNCTVSCFLVHLIRRPLAFDKFILALCLLLPRIKLAPTATLTCFEPSPFYAHFAHTLLKVSLHVMFLRVSRSVFILPTLQANIKTLALNDTVIIIVYAYPIQI